MKIRLLQQGGCNPYINGPNVTQILVLIQLLSAAFPEGVTLLDMTMVSGNGVFHLLYRLALPVILTCIAAVVSRGILYLETKTPAFVRNIWMV